MKRLARLTLTLFAAAALSAATACARPTPEQQTVNDAAAALGGSDRILAVKTLVIEGEGTAGNLGQDVTPDATGQTFTVTAYKRSIDVAAGRARIEQTRTPNFPYFQGQQPQTQVSGVDAAVGYNVAADGTFARVPDAAAKDRRAEIYHHPITIVRAALDPAAKLFNPRTLDNQNSVDVTTANGLTFTLAIDGTTKLPTSVVSMTDNTNLGDVAIVTTFADYQDVSGLKLPARLTTKTDQYTTADLRVTKQTVDGDAGDLAAPAAAASAAPVPAAAPANVTVTPVATGIWLLAGQSHHSVLVEFADHLTLIEAPQSDTRSLAVIAKAREVVPGKPLTQVVNSHHHFDHSGGIRAAVSEGLEVIVQSQAGVYFQDSVARSHTLVPDALTMNPTPKPLMLQTVDEELELKDSAMTMNLYRLTGITHADTMLVAYFPRERVLVEADAYTPGAAVAPWAASLLENIKRRNLRVDRIVPLHGMIGPFSGLVKTAQAAPSN